MMTSGANAAHGRCSTASRSRSIQVASGQRCSCIRAATSTAITARRARKSCGCPACRMPGRRRRNFPASNFTRRCCCRFTITISKASKPTMRRVRTLNMRCAAQTSCAKADSWPPPGTRYTHWYLNASPSGSVSSLNDGGLSPQASKRRGFDDVQISQSRLGIGRRRFWSGRAARRLRSRAPRAHVTTAPLDSDLEICGPIKLVLYASSTARDTDFFIKLSDQFPQSPDDRGKGLNPFAELITRGWLRASHRALDPARSTDMVPYHSHSDPQPLDAERDLQIRDQPRADGLSHQAGSSRCGLRSSTAIRRRPKFSGRIITGRTRSEATRSITTRRIRRN